MNKHIVIIGGMGPQASLELHKRIIDGALIRGARNGHEFPQITHLSLPVRDFINGSEMSAAVTLINQACRQLYLWREYTSCYCL